MTLLELDIFLPVLCLRKQWTETQFFYSPEICCCVGLLFFLLDWGCGFFLLMIKQINCSTPEFHRKIQSSVLSSLALLTFWLSAESLLKHEAVCIPECCLFQGEQEEIHGRYSSQDCASPSSACSIPGVDSCCPKDISVHAKSCWAFNKFSKFIFLFAQLGLEICYFGFSKYLEIFLGVY